MVQIFRNIKQTFLEVMKDEIEPLVWVKNKIINLFSHKTSQLNQSEIEWTLHKRVIAGFCITYVILITVSVFLVLVALVEVLMAK